MTMHARKFEPMSDDQNLGERPRGEKVKIAGYTMPLPRSRILRIVIGVLLILGGIFSFLPVLGVWMLPLGLIVLSVDIPRVRRWRRRFDVWFTRRYPKLAAKFRNKPAASEAPRAQ